MASERSACLIICAGHTASLCAFAVICCFDAVCTVCVTSYKAYIDCLCCKWRCRVVSHNVVSAMWFSVLAYCIIVCVGAAVALVAVGNSL